MSSLMSEWLGKGGEGGRGEERGERGEEGMQGGTRARHYGGPRTLTRHEVPSSTAIDSTTLYTVSVKHNTALDVRACDGGASPDWPDWADAMLPLHWAAVDNRGSLGGMELQTRHAAWRAATWRAGDRRGIEGDALMRRTQERASRFTAATCGAPSRWSSRYSQRASNAR